MKTLVTGGAGFIGSTLVDRLLDDGHDVVVVDNLSTGNLANLEKARSLGRNLAVHEEDIRSDDMQVLINEAQPEVIFHLAAQLDVRVSVADPVFDASVNVVGSLNVLEGARTAGVRKIVFAASGGTLYGEAPDEMLPLDESTPQRPISPYGISKKAVTDYLFGYSRLYGLDYASLALANVFGPRQEPHGEAGVVAIFGRRLLAGEKCKIFGDGTATRDYVYVDDVVDAFVGCATKGTGLFNVGTGVETSTTDLYMALAEAAKVTDEPEYAAARSGELARSALDSTKLMNELGWKPQTALLDGCVNVLDHIRSNG